MMSNDRNLNKEICIEYPLFQSQKGNYFIGQTPILTGIGQDRVSNNDNTE